MRYNYLHVLQIISQQQGLAQLDGVKEDNTELAQRC